MTTLPRQATEELERWEEELELWSLDRISDFFVDEETGQLGAACIGRDPGSVSYFRPL